MLLFRLKRYINCCTINGKKSTYTKFINSKNIFRYWNTEMDKVYYIDKIIFHYRNKRIRSILFAKNFNLITYKTRENCNVKYRFHKNYRYNLTHTIDLDVDKKVLRTELTINCREFINGIAKYCEYEIVYDDKNILEIIRNNGKDEDYVVYNYNYYDQYKNEWYISIAENKLQLKTVLIYVINYRISKFCRGYTQDNVKKYYVNTNNG